MTVVPWITPGSVLTMLGYGVGLAVFALTARREREVPLDLVGLWALAGGVLGAKLAEWTVTRAIFSASTSTAMLDPRSGGRTVLGGLLGGWLAVALFKRRNGIPRPVGDPIALALPAGEAIGRIGCHLNGCCYGVACRIPGSVYQHGAWRFPSQLVSAAAMAALCAALILLRRRPSRQGEQFDRFLVLYGAVRLALEFTRERPILLAGLSLAQCVCLALIAAGVWRLSRARQLGPLEVTARVS